MDETFTQWITRLQSRVAQLQKDSARMSVEELARERDTCASFLQNLYDHAEKHNINIIPYYQQLAEIQFHLSRIDEQVDARKQVPSPVRDLQQATEAIAGEMARKGCLTLLLGLRLWDQPENKSNAPMTKARRKRDE
jgi:hypothetical protein